MVGVRFPHRPQSMKNENDQIRNTSGEEKILPRNKETYRFELSDETIKYLKQAKLDLFELQKIAPCIKGFTFFGSRIVKGETEKSDLDYIIFYDEEEYRVQDYSHLPSIYNIYNEWRELDKRLTFNEWLVMVNNKSQCKVPYGVGAAINVSSDGIKNNVAGFIREIEKYPKDKLGGYSWSIVSTFFLGVGDEIEKIRYEILSRIEREKNGEAIFQAVMEKLSSVERTMATKKRPGLTDYIGYPKTIAEAKKYFLKKTTEI